MQVSGIQFFLDILGRFHCIHFHQLLITQERILLLTFKHKRFQGLIWLCRSVSSSALISSTSYAGGFMSRYLLAIGVVTVSRQVISTFQNFYHYLWGKRSKMLFVQDRCWSMRRTRSCHRCTLKASKLGIRLRRLRTPQRMLQNGGFFPPELLQLSSLCINSVDHLSKKN